MHGQEMIKKLEAGWASKAGAAAHGVPPPTFQYYISFRYAPPLTHDTLLAMAADGVTRAVAFSQYPQFSCTTTGSSFNHLWRETLRLGLQDTFKWSVIDRWYRHPTYVKAVAQRIRLGLQQFDAADRDKVLILFSAHSIPSMIVNRGDPYTTEIAATADAVMRELAVGEPRTRPFTLSWQSKVGFLPWMGPPTSGVIKGLAAQGHKHVLTVPIAFTSDHVETLYEIDIEYAHEAAEAGITHFKRAPSLNDEPLLSQALAECVTEHLLGGQASTPEYALNCAGCTNPACRTVLNPVVPYAPLRAANADCTVPRWPTAADAAALRANAARGPCH